MFGNKGQSALEYLMTYGWALIVIVIAIAALVFLINPTQIGAEGCTGAGKLPIKTQNLTGPDTGDTFTIVLTNMTGQNLTNFTVSSTGNLVDSNNIGSVVANEEVKFDSILDAGDSFTANGAYTVNFTFAYTDGDGFSKSSTASCKGTSPA